MKTIIGLPVIKAKDALWIAFQSELSEQMNDKNHSKEVEAFFEILEKIRQVSMDGETTIDICQDDYPNLELWCIEYYFRKYKGILEYDFSSSKKGGKEFDHNKDDDEDMYNLRIHWGWSSYSKNIS